MIENPNVICNDCGFGKQNKQLKDKCERLEKQLEIAVEALKDIYKWADDGCFNATDIAEKSLRQIKELENE